jgi:hypothetical protein
MYCSREDSKYTAGTRPWDSYSDEWKERQKATDYSYHYYRERHWAHGKRCERA